MSYEPLHHKYRPSTFAELVGQDAIATTLTNAIRTEKIAPAYLFTGPRGTGKTSSARILAKSLNCLKANKPTAEPCGVCEVCQGIANGSALDVIEIDAASNTGVDNIRELIERAQFAPVQCRYKVYVIDECLSGDSLVQTSEGLIRIDDPNIKGKKVLSYNDSSRTWEFKKVVRWLDQGERQTLVIKTTNREIRCTANHLVRTETGWVQAKDITREMAILSPVSADAAPSYHLGQMDALGNSFGGTITCELTLVENGWQLPDSIQFPRWSTRLEIVESVQLGEMERVYDIEVKDNHNFVANGLGVHNCHMLSTAAFNSLLKTLEEPPERVVFVLATTDPQRVLPTIISRCQRFDYRRIPLEAMVEHLSAIASKENINITPEAVRLVAQVSQGGLRDAESLLDQLSLLSGQVTVERVWDLVGSCSEPDLIELLQAIAQNHPEAILDSARRIMDRGREPLTVLQNLAGFYRDLLIAKTASSRNDLVAVTPPTWKALGELARLWDIPTILAGQKHLKDSEVQIKNTTQPRLWLEVTLLGLLPAANSAQSEESSTQPSALSYQRLETTSNKPVVSPRTTHQQPPAHPAQSIPTAAANSVSPSEPTPTVVPSDRVSIPNTPAEVKPDRSASQPPSVVDTSLSDLERIWQQMLECLPLSAKALCGQHGRLLAINGQQAQIAIRSQKLLKMAQTKSAEMEAAFQKVLQQKVKVSLEVAALPQPKTAPVNEPRSPSTSPAPAASPQVAEPLASHPATSSTQSQTKSQFQAEMTALTQPLQPPSGVLESPATNTETHAPTTTADSESDEFAIATQSLVKAFNGEIVKLNLDSAFPDSAKTNSLPLPTRTDADRWYDADGEDEAEIEF